MMDTEIVVTDDVPNKYIPWSKKVFNRIGPDITYGGGKHTHYKYSIKSPVDKLFIVNKKTYNEVLQREKVGTSLIMNGKFPTYSKTGNPSYEKFTLKQFDFSLGFWVPHRANYDLLPGTPGCSGDIYISYEDINCLAERIENYVPEVPKQKVTELCYKAALLHEIGHHLTLTNQPYDVICNLKQCIDAISYEGMAGMIAYLLSTKDEKFVITEIAAHQNISYRAFLYFKHANVTRIFEYLATPGMIDQMPSALSHVFGGIHNLNGYLCYVNNDYNGVAVDWSDRGGKIIAGGKIKAVTTFLDGLFITPTIELLIGRFPKNVLIITNKIETIADYKIIPNNILRLPENKFPINDFIKQALKMPVTDRIQFLLSKFPIGVDYIALFRDRTTEIDEWVKEFSSDVE